MVCQVVIVVVVVVVVMVEFEWSGWYLLFLGEGAGSLPEVAWTRWRKKTIVRRHTGALRGQ